MKQNKLMELTPDKWGLLVYLSDHNALDLATVKRFMNDFSLVWYSDINGAIGAGERFSTANLSCGAHRITLMVNDSTGLISTQSIALTITNDWTPGDLNHDSTLTPADAAIALQIAAGGSASCDAATLAAADVNNDSRVTSLDALMILQAAAGAIEL